MKMKEGLGVTFCYWPERSGIGLTSNSDEVSDIRFSRQTNGETLNQLSSQKSPNCSALAHMTDSDPFPATTLQIGPVPVRYTSTRWE